MSVLLHILRALTIRFDSLCCCVIISCSVAAVEAASEAGEALQVAKVVLQPPL